MMTSTTSTDIFSTDELKRYFIKFVDPDHFPTMALLNKAWSEAVKFESAHKFKKDQVLWAKTGQPVAKLVVKTVHRNGQDWVYTKQLLVTQVVVQVPTFPQSIGDIGFTLNVCGTLAGLTPTETPAFGTYWSRAVSYIAIVSDAWFLERVDLPPHLKAVSPEFINMCRLQGDPARCGSATIAFVDPTLPTPSELQKVLGHLVQTHVVGDTLPPTFIAINVSVGHFRAVLDALRALSDDDFNPCKHISCYGVQYRDFTTDQEIYRTIMGQTALAMLGPKPPVLPYDRERVYTTTNRAFIIRLGAPPKRTLIKRASRGEMLYNNCGVFHRSTIRNELADNTVALPYVAQKFRRSNVDMMASTGVPGEVREAGEVLVVV